MENGEADGEISGVAARGRSGSAARAGNADIFVRNFLSFAEERGVGTAGFRRRIRGVAVKAETEMYTEGKKSGECRIGES